MNWLNLIEENWMLKAGKLKSKKNYKKKAKTACCMTTLSNAMECNFHVSEGKPVHHKPFTCTV